MDLQPCLPPLSIKDIVAATGCATDCMQRAAHRGHCPLVWPSGGGLRGTGEFACMTDNCEIIPGVKTKKQIDSESNPLSKYLEKRAARGMQVGDDVAEVTVSKAIQQNYKSIDSRLNTLEAKLGHIESLTSQLQTAMDAMNGKVDRLERRFSNVEQLTKQIDDDLEDFNEDFEALQLTTENTDYSLSKYNIKLRGLKEGLEGEDLKGYITHLVTAWAGSDCEIGISITSAYQIGTLRDTNRYPREELIQCPNWTIKSKILEIFLEQSDWEIADSQLQIFPDLSPITLKKIREFTFLTSTLTSLNIKYRWGFPFKLIVYSGGKSIRTFHEAKDLYGKLSGERGLDKAEEAKRERTTVF